LKKTPLKPGTKPLSRSTPIQRKPIQRKAVMPSAPNNAKTGLSVTGAVKSRPKKPKPKKPKATDYKRWCDELFSLIVRSRGACERCGSQLNLQCSHIVSRGYLATRWNEMNALSACRGCHHWQHMNPLENEEWLASIGIDTLKLKHLALTHEKPDYVATLTQLVARAEELDLEISLAKFKKAIPKD
jgi:5-methylcytosine-specific restriction endonuclease McrA